MKHRCNSSHLPVQVIQWSSSLCPSSVLSQIVSDRSSISIDIFTPIVRYIIRPLIAPVDCLLLAILWYWYRWLPVCVLARGERERIESNKSLYITICIQEKLIYNTSNPPESFSPQHQTCTHSFFEWTRILNKAHPQRLPVTYPVVTQLHTPCLQYNVVNQNTTHDLNLPLTLEMTSHQHAPWANKKLYSYCISLHVQPIWTTCFLLQKTWIKGVTEKRRISCSGAKASNQELETKTHPFSLFSSNPSPPPTLSLPVLNYSLQETAQKLTPSVNTQNTPFPVW